MHLAEHVLNNLTYRMNFNNIEILDIEQNYKNNDYFENGLH